jgi:hypothetical protein
VEEWSGSGKAGLDLRIGGMGVGQNSELTNSSYACNSLFLPPLRYLITDSNIPSMNGTEEEAKEGGRKRSKKSCTPTGPMKKGAISLARRAKAKFWFSYFGWNLPIVLFCACIGVESGRDREALRGGGVVVMMATC